MAVRYLNINQFDSVRTAEAPEKSREKTSWPGMTLTLDEVSIVLEIHRETILGWSKIGVIKPISGGAPEECVYSIGEVRKFLPRQI